jgi:3-dehydroquinate synthase
VYTVTKRVLARCGLPVRLPEHFDTDAVMDAMSHDKKFKEGRMVYVVPTAIGKVEIDKNISAALIRGIVDQLKEEAELS